MGCWISAPKHKEEKNTTFDGEYVAVTPPTRGLSKRLWKSRHSYASSSGVSSGFNTPTRGSKAYSSRCSSPEIATETPVKKSLNRPESKNNLIYENLPAFLRNVPLDIELDDDDEDQYIEKNFNIEAMLDQSGGYYTEDSSDCSTPLGTVNTQGDSESDDSQNSTSSEFELDMEMRMMGKAFGIMPKTSSPVFERRDVTFNTATVYTAPLPIPSASYQKWRKYLQMTPTSALHNITNIPEAIAGRFCPAEFPAYSECQGLPNTLSSKLHNRNQYKETSDNVAETIIMELPVPTITTEL